MPTGIFGEQGGKTKQLYDYLYSQMRGAVIPRRKVRIPKDRLMEKAGIGSEVTLRKNLVRLRAAGLVQESIFPGTHGGNEYEVFMPEEISLTASTPSTPPTPSIPRQHQEGVEAVENRGSSPSINHGVSTGSSQDQTLSKDAKDYSKTDDDEAFANLRHAMKESTGREVSAQALAEIDELLAIEFKVAASRTTVSSAPAFLAVHLLRIYPLRCLFRR